MTRLGGLETWLLPTLFDESQGFFTMHTTIHSSVQHLAFEHNFVQKVLPDQNVFMRLVLLDQNTFKHIVLEHV